MNLVREYVSCMDEMSQIHDISMQKIKFLGKLQEHYMGIERFVRGNLIEEIDDAIKQIMKDNESLPQLVNDLKSSLDVVTVSGPYIQSLS